MVLALSAPDGLADGNKATGGAAPAKIVTPAPTKIGAPTKKVSKRPPARKPKKVAASNPAPERIPAPEPVSVPEPPPVQIWTIDAAPAPKPAPASKATPAATAPTPAAAPTPVGTTTTSSAVISPNAEAPATPVKALAPTGLVLEVGPEIVVPATPFTSGDRPFGPGLGLEVRAGYYFAQHVGVIAGMRASVAHHVPSCDDYKGVGFQIPVVVQLAASRSRGA